MLIDKAVAENTAALSGLQEVVAVELARIEFAKDNTDRLMNAIEHKASKEQEQADGSQLEEIRDFIAPKSKPVSEVPRIRQQPKEATDVEVHATA